MNYGYDYTDKWVKTGSAIVAVLGLLLGWWLGL